MWREWRIAGADQDPDPGSNSNADTGGNAHAHTGADVLGEPDCVHLSLEQHRRERRPGSIGRRDASAAATRPRWHGIATGCEFAGRHVR